jgi:hypothetical protein
MVSLLKEFVCAEPIHMTEAMVRSHAGFAFVNEGKAPVSFDLGDIVVDPPDFIKMTVKTDGFAGLRLLPGQGVVLAMDVLLRVDLEQVLKRDRKGANRGLVLRHPPSKTIELSGAIRFFDEAEEEEEEAAPTAEKEEEEEKVFNSSDDELYSSYDPDAEGPQTQELAPLELPEAAAVAVVVVPSTVDTAVTPTTIQPAANSPASRSIPLNVKLIVPGRAGPHAQLSVTLSYHVRSNDYIRQFGEEALEAAAAASRVASMSAAAATKRPRPTEETEKKKKKPVAEPANPT